MLPVIAIVGRPNVGKSTLFNRLTHTRNAVISAYPGTTRDRQFGKVDIENRQFIIIDTGGITEEAFSAHTQQKNVSGKEFIDQSITKQAMLAIQDADQILFLIDGRAGILSEDRLIAETLRKLGKPITLVVNKTEGLDPNLAIADAYVLGLKQPIAIAAAHGTGVSHLITTLFPKPIVYSNEETYEQTGTKIAIVGRPNVGKSTLTNRIMGEERVIVHDSPGTTRDSIYIPLKRLDKTYTIIDTAGVRKRNKIEDIPEKFSVVKTLQSIQDAHVVIMVIDARIAVSDQDLKLLGFILECGKGLVIAINKWDGMTDDARNHARNTIDRQLDFVPFARVHFISALHGSGVGNLFTSVDEAYHSASRKLSTPQLTRLLQQATVTHTPPLVHGRRVKLRYAHAGGQNPPRIIIHGNQVNALPESYRRFLSNYFFKKLELYGTPVLIEFKANDNPFGK